MLNFLTVVLIDGVAVAAAVTAPVVGIVRVDVISFNVVAGLKGVGAVVAIDISWPFELLPTFVQRGRGIFKSFLKNLAVNTTVKLHVKIN